MKNKILHLLMAFVVVASVSCKKDPGPDDPNDPNNPNNPGTKCYVEKAAGFDMDEFYDVNADGLILKLTVKNKNGAEQSRIEYTRNSSGKITHQKEYGLNNNLRTEWKLTYSGNSISKIEHVDYSTGSTNRSDVTAQYNNSGQITALLFYFANSNILWARYRFEYEGNNLVKINHGEANQTGGPIVERTETTFGDYDDKINPKSKWGLFFPTSLNNPGFEYEKNMAANFYNWKAYHTYTYNDKNNLIKVVTNYAEMEFDFVTDYTYKCQ